MDLGTRSEPELHSSFRQLGYPDSHANPNPNNPNPMHGDMHADAEAAPIT